MGWDYSRYFLSTPKTDIGPIYKHDWDILLAKFHVTLFFDKAPVELINNNKKIEHKINGVHTINCHWKPISNGPQKQNEVFHCINQHSLFYKEFFFTGKNNFSCSSLSQNF